MLTSRAGLFILLAVVTGAYPQTNAKASKDEQDTKTIKVQTELIQVRAVVTDPSGRPIDGLTKDDFLLLEDRVEQPLSFFSLERIESTPSVKPKSASGKTSGVTNADPHYNPHPASSRALVLLVDTIHLSHDSLESARAALKRFVADQATDQDAVALMTTSGKPGVKAEFTRDRNELLAAINKVRLWQVPSESLLTPSLCGKVVRREQDAEKLARQINDSEERSTGSLLIDSGNPGLSQAEAFGKCRQILMEASQRRQLAMSALRTVIVKLAAMPGQRIVAMFSDGFSMTATGGEIAAVDIRPAISRAVRDGIVLYTFDAKGMTPVMLTASQIYPSLVANDEGTSEMHESVRDTQLGLSALASETGGQAFFNTNDFNQPMQMMLDNNRIYYELTYYTPTDKDPTKYREISVAVKNHPEYHVRAQRGYVLADLRGGK
jgi:VWFA-related protein